MEVYWIKCNFASDWEVVHFSITKWYTFGLPYTGNKAAKRNFDYNYDEINKFLKEKEKEKFGNSDFMDSALSIFAVHSIESKLPRTNFAEKSIDTFQFYSTSNGISIGHYKAYEKNKKYSAVYQKTFFMKDTVTGLDSYGSYNLVAYEDAGNNRPVFIPNSPSLTRPSITSLFDISQSYFHFNIGIPTDTIDTMIEFDFGGAADFSKMYPEPDFISMSAIAFKDPEKLAYIYNQGLWFHVKFKQMENIQILRMFIMTTLFGFFVALAFSSAFKGIKLASRKYRTELSQVNIHSSSD